ncbi:MAG: hypothetical protein LBM04_08685 [Opitutaceae bacterium]|nr:hypothetical protein [Opitutaceae bacterium]
MKKTHTRPRPLRLSRFLPLPLPHSLRLPLALSLLTLSLLANTTLAILLHRATNANAPAPGSPAAAIANATTPRAAASSDAAILATIKTGDANALLAQLKTAGLPDKTARFMAAALEFQKFADQMAELAPDQPHWRNRTPQTPEQRLKMRQTTHALQTTMTELLADTIPQIGLGSQRYAYLAPERRAALRRLEKDYDDLSAEMLATADNFRLQSDTDNLKTLADERKREINQFHTPEEIAARDMRESPAARQIRNDYGNIIENETEYQTIYATMQAAGNDPAAQAAARAQIEAALGPDRMTRLAQLNDPDYELIQSAATRLALPAAETTAAITAIRSEARQAADAIAADKTLTPAQRKTALQTLATQSRAQIETTLGPEGADTYANRSQWMRALKNGSTFTIDERGKFKTKR